ncbi:MAG TPA: S8 family serine peptidase [Burkholderiaceae bacterium]|nr:S8 family serine peptidase [Burkholderiaceae bacterium]
MNFLRSAVTRACLGAALATTIAGSVSAADDTARFIVEFKPGMAAQAREALAAAGGRVKLEMFDGEAVAAELPRHLVAALRQSAAVFRVEEDAKRYLMSMGEAEADGGGYKPGQDIPYGIQMVQADQLSDANADNRMICIIDSGYSRDHEDLSGNDVDGEFDSGTGNWYEDGLGHGTHVGGTISAINNKNTGVVGVNPNKHIKLHIIKVFDENGAFTYSSTLAVAAKRCGKAGANVISMSLGGGAPNSVEQKAFDDLDKAGVLSIAAAGNGGNGTLSYPAGYASVLSVAAIDENKNWATFSQYNSDVELAAPGVHVLSTWPMGKGTLPALSVGKTHYAPGSMDGSPLAKVTAPLYDFGLGDKVDDGVAGQVCLIQRGTIDFATKVTNCETSGGVGAVIYNNVAGSFDGTLGETQTNIPSMSASDKEGAKLLAQLGKKANLVVAVSNYAFLQGTSMATPHVSAVAALVWSYFPKCTNAQLRTSLEKSALDIGDQGFDDKTGYGLVQAKAAHDRIAKKGCGK